MTVPYFNIHEDFRYRRHEDFIRALLPNKNKYGYYAISSIKNPSIKVPTERLKATFLNLNKTYTEALSYSQRPIAHPDGYSRIYEVRNGTDDPGNSQITTCYFDGLIVTDGYIDIFCEGKDGLNPNWFFYKIQRHLQLSKEIFQDLIDNFIFNISFQYLEKFKWEIYRGGHLYKAIPYVGYYHDIISEVNISDIHGRDKWNIKMDIVEGIMIEVARIYGMEQLPQPYWLDNQELDYSHGMPDR